MRRNTMQSVTRPVCRASALLLLALVLALPGIHCTEDESAYPSNVAPTTYLALLGDTLNTTNYHIILSWWGTDTDGRVIGYAYRWEDPWRPELGDSLWWEDSTWTFTTATRDTFDVPIGGSYAERTFRVVAIDNDLAADPTPASQSFPLENAVPLIAWSDTTRHPTPARGSLPAVSFAFTPEDFDGRKTIDHTRMWLDVAPGEDSAAAAIEVAGKDTVGAFFEEHFQGRYGPRTVYAQTFDRAATGSDIISWSWTVTPPEGEYLLIDNAGARGASGQSIANRQDQFWDRSSVGAFELFAPGDYHVYDVWEDGVFRSPQEVLPILRLFKGVLWYGGVRSSATTESDAQMVAGLQLAEASLYDYVAGGGRLLIASRDAIGTRGGLSTRFAQETFGLGTIFTHVEGDQYVSNATLPDESVVRCGEAFGDVDSLVMRNAVFDTDFFRITPAVEPLLWLPHDRLSERLHPEPDSAEVIYAGALATWGDGRFALCSTLLTRFEDTGGGMTAEEAVAELLRRVLGP